MKFILTFFLLCSGLLVGCAQQDEKKFSDRAEVEGRAANKADQEAQNERARLMERDLADRHNFYNALEGVYSGTVQFGNQNYNIKFTMVRSIPPYLGERTRQISEVENDLNNLSFHIQVVQWYPDDPSTAVGCRVSQIRPDMQKGIMTIASPDCPNLYTVVLSDLIPDKSGLNEKAKGIAEKIKNHEISVVEGLAGTIQPTSNANVFQFSVRRTQ